jgi:hypothetical protein
VPKGFNAVFHRCGKCQIHLLIKFGIPVVVVVLTIIVAEFSVHKSPSVIGFERPVKTTTREPFDFDDCSYWLAYDCHLQARSQNFEK